MFYICRFFYFIVLFLPLTGCIPQVLHHGVVLEEKQIKALKPGVSTKAQVYRILGSPSSYSPFERSTWYYVTRVTESVTFFAPQVLENRVYILTFSPQDILEKVEKIEKDKIIKVDYVKRTTPISGHKTPLTQQVIKNLRKVTTPIKH